MKHIPRTLLLMGILIGLQSCGIKNENPRFEQFTRQYIEGYLQLYPERATALGDHRYDHLLNDYSIAGYQNALKFQKDNRVYIRRIEVDRLSDVNQVDYHILQDRIERAIFQLEVLKEYEWNPRIYNVGGAIYNLVARDFAPLEERLVSVKDRLLLLPQVLDNARINLQNPPRIFTETAIRQNQGTISLIRVDLDEFVNQVPGLAEQLKPARDAAVAALEAYGQWLETDLLPRSTGNFRLGEEKFCQKLRFTLESDISMEEILSRAETDLLKVQNEIYQTALEIHRRSHAEASEAASLSEKKKIITAVLDRLADEHPDNETIVPTIERTLAETRQFVIENDLVTVPDDPIDIIVMPEFKRGVSSAYCDAPGPLEQDKRTFYAISPAPADWPEEQVISTFREDNNYMLHDLTIHEAMPGHYLQLTHANRFQAPTKVRAIFSSGPFIEGWATYAEQMMIAHGYGGLEVKMQQLKMRLRVIVNAIIDQKIHTAGMTEEEAMKLMLEEGFQEEGEAAAKWRRACLTSTQLTTYYVGNLGMNDIRRDYEAKMGDRFNLKQFNDAVLSFGSPPLKYVRQMMGL